MARLVIHSADNAQRALELRLGINRVGRATDNDFAIEHPTISTHHCEFILSGEGVMFNDLHSTNGSFINGEPVGSAWLEAGQQLRLGDVELLVESTEITVAIPKFERAVTVIKPPVQLEDGALVCPRHEHLLATFKCLSCAEVMCSGCVRMMRRQGGMPLFLCVVCHNKCERISLQPAKVKKGFLGYLQDTVRLKFGGRPKS